MKDLLPKDITAMIREWGLEDLPEEKQVEMVDRIGRLLYQAVLVRTLDILSDKDQEEFDALLDLDTTTPQEVLVFLNSKISTFEQLVTEERNNLKEELLIPVS